MKLIIPMAGRGTRVVRILTPHPNRCLPVAGTMIVERIMETFARTLNRTITEIVYILGPDFGKEIKETLQEMSDRHNARLHSACRKPPLVPRTCRIVCR
jgi:glucose-1-phosphate thymidylyltransferase